MNLNRPNIFLHFFKKSIDKTKKCSYNNKRTGVLKIKRIKGAFIMKNMITYTVNRNWNHAFYLSVQNGEVAVKAPWYYTDRQIQEMMNEKKQWILNKIQEYKEEKEKAYIRNEIVGLLGEDCKVIINYKNLKKPTLTVEGKNIKICLPNKYKKLDRDEILVKLIEKLYDMVAQKEIELAMERIRKMVGFAPEDFKLMRMKNKIASCEENGIIIINPDIVKYGREIIDYIVLHEFCHLKYKTHCKKFYDLVKTHMPKYHQFAEQIIHLIY